MAADRRRDGGAALHKSGFVSLGAPKRTKAGPKLAVPRPVNLPSLKKENAGTEPSGAGGAGGGAGWAGSREPEGSSHAAEPGPGPSLVEKAGWAQGRPAAAPPAPWEQPARALSMREFPSLAAAATLPQQQHRPPSQPEQQHGAWDEDERGRGMPTGPGRPSRPAFRGRSQDARFDPAFGGGDDGEFHGPPPPHAAGVHYGRHRGEFSPPPPHRRFDEEPPYGRYGGPPPPGPGPYWRDEPPQRYGPPRRDFGGRYGRGGGPIDHEPEYAQDRHGRYPDQGGRYERYGPQGGDPREQDPALFPPPPPGQPHSRQAHSPPERERDASQQRRGRGDKPAPHLPAAEPRPSPAAAAEVQAAPPPPPSPKQQPAAEQLANGAGEPAAPEPHSAAEPSAPAHQQQAAAQQQRKGAAGERKAERQAAAQPAGKAAGGKRDPPAQQAPPPPPPPAVPKPPPPAAPPVKCSVVKPGISWKSMLAGVADEQAAPAQPASGSDAGDKASKRERGRGKKEGKKEGGSAAGLAGAAAQLAPAPAAAAGEAGKQRSKQRTRGGKKGVAAGEEGAQPEAAQQQAAGRTRGRGRGKDAAEQPAGAETETEEFEGAAAAPAESPPEPLPAAAAAIDAAPAQLAQPLVAPPLAAPPAALVAAPAGAAASAGVSAPLMGAAFGWSSPLADEVAKLQLSSAAAPDGGASLPPLAPTTTAEQQLASSLALLPTLGRDLREPSPPLQAAPAGGVASHAEPSAGSVADVLTSLPADLSLDLAAAHPPAAPAVGAGQPFPSASPPPPSASPPPFPGGLFPATTASWAQPPSKEAVQLFEGAAGGPSFAFGSITSTPLMQFGPVAAAFGQQQPQLGAGGGVDWSSPAPSPPPYLAQPPLGAPGMFGPPGHVSQYGPPPGLGSVQQQQQQQQMHQARSMMPGGPHAGPYGMPHLGMAPQHQHQQHHQQQQQYQQQQYQQQQQQQVLCQLPAALEDPAAALPDDVFDAPPQQHAGTHQGQSNGQPRGRNYSGRGRQRGPRYAAQPQQQQPQHAHAQVGAYGVPPGGVYQPAGNGFPQQMPSWASQAPHFLPPQLVGSRQQQSGSSSARGRGRGRNAAASGGNNRGGNRGQPKQPQQWVE